MRKTIITSLLLLCILTQSACEISAARIRRAATDASILIDAGLELADQLQATGGLPVEIIERARRILRDKMRPATVKAIEIATRYAALEGEQKRLTRRELAGLFADVLEGLNELHALNIGNVQDEQLRLRIRAALAGLTVVARWVQSRLSD